MAVQKRTYRVTKFMCALTSTFGLDLDYVGPKSTFSLFRLKIILLPNGLELGISFHEEITRTRIIW